MREIKLEEQGIEYREETEVYIVFCWRILDLEMNTTEDGGLDIDPIIDAAAIAHPLCFEITPLAICQIKAHHRRKLSIYLLLGFCALSHILVP